MISWLGGTVRDARDGFVVLDVGGVGYGVAVTSEQALAAREGDELALHTSLVVRDDALALYGFADRQALTTFEILLGVSGIGPRSALGVLSALTTQQIARAVADEDDAPFRRVSGIGPKTAKLIVVSLAGRLAPPAAGPPPATESVAAPEVESVVEALVGLGWPERAAVDAVDTVVAGTDPSARPGVPALLRLALAHLGPRAPHGAGARDAVRR